MESAFPTYSIIICSPFFQSFCIFYISSKKKTFEQALLDCLPVFSLLSAVDQSMFENSSAGEQLKQGTKLSSVSSRRDFSSPGGQKSSTHLKNLGKAMGAKVNDLLRRKEPGSLGDIGVTEVNKNVGAVWSSHNVTANR